MIREAAALAMVALVSGCATHAVGPLEAEPVSTDRLYAFQHQPDGPYGTITLLRDSGFTGAGCDQLVTINRQKAAEIEDGESASFYLKPGQALLGVDTRGICGGGLKEEVVNVEEGQIYYFRSSIDTSMSLDLSPTIY
ncbi:hypothetical protein [Salinicola rhizosphaerae]|uniref:DUF2846 domain-containing protein n=1 Tax=Salinicola rhizosphaerae TaxID=1443141 RepID=A0ABQ3DVA1_9GAMM|nr:hypothetical protein [Salinicola rhizosphaerae]GHB08947.1 hypothetical protein GCM10009038_03090 [Salinicola rhizosphaerae]